MSITNDTTNVESIACNNSGRYDIEKDGCEVSYHPCYYSGIIEAVYKGNMQQVRFANKVLIYGND